MKMTSIVLPYWKRQNALRAFLAAHEEFHAEQSVEIVIVDDGSPPEEAASVVIDQYREGGGGMEVRLFELPKKTARMNPCVPLNRGVREARGEVIMITGPEVIPQKPVLRDLLDALSKLGPKGYVAASCWDPVTERWNQHSEKRDAFLPFCVVMYRKHFFDVGGYDEAYRNGHGKDDVDFVRALRKAGTSFLARDDLLTHHRLDLQGEHRWDPTLQQKNRSFFSNKWSSA